jgi:preprotein translocase subunit SecE
MNGDDKKISLKEKRDENRAKIVKGSGSKAAPVKDDARKPDAKKKDAKKKSNFGQKAVRFIKDSFGELKKVTWPTRKEWLAYSEAVLVFVAIMTNIVGVLDTGMSNLLQLILK